MMKIGCDARKLTASSLTELRIRAVELIQSGTGPETVIKMLKISRGAIYSWLALYRQGGWHSLDAKKRGGRPTLINGKMLKWIYDLVTLKNPLQLKFEFALWTSKMLIKVIYDKYGINISKASMCRLLNQLGLTPQKPIWKAYQQNQTEVQKWLKYKYPSIKRKAIKERAKIYFGDEAGIRSDHHFGTTWAPKGKTPVIRTTGSRFSYSLFSAVSPRGDFRFMINTGKQGSKQFMEFLRRLIINEKRKVILIVDGHPMHHSKAVKNFCKLRKEKLELFYLPPYSPELNPDELVWNDLKNNGIGKKVIEDKDNFKREIFSYLKKIQKAPERVIAYFQNPYTRYAA